ncbi:hypothetical protein [Massilia sp. MS-15]|uniref:hypothetical protein n=1 Tax=Massilia sp. MS-15 TaxID=2878200 RepID=UPI001CD26749|nr:hypothetical protein [Massilia sp. MS-15]MCA1246439.1 hypothetical protein [Massilia sp. MS-15]
MSLPELSWQFAYARLGWALVLAALVAGLLELLLARTQPQSWRLPRKPLAAIVLLSLAWMALPGEASPAWHLGLAFQSPSALLASLCAASLLARWHGVARSGPRLPLPLAAALAAAGALLYLDAFGLFAHGYYHAGFGAGAALLAVLLAAACAACIGRGQARAQAGALLGAILLFSGARLPTGNLWDALLDPLLWIWALSTLGLAGLHVVRRRGMRRRLPVEQQLPAMQAGGTEPFTSLKESS